MQFWDDRFIWNISDVASIQGILLNVVVYLKSSSFDTYGLSNVEKVSFGWCKVLREKFNLYFFAQRFQVFDRWYVHYFYNKFGTEAIPVIIIITEKWWWIIYLSNVPNPDRIVERRSLFV